MTRLRQLLTVAHSYGVALNRRLAHEMARAGAGRWHVTAAAPRFLYGDLRPVPLEAFNGERCRLEPVTAHFSRRIHLMVYGRALRDLLKKEWDLVHCWEEPYVLSGGQVFWWTPRRTPLVFWTAQNLSKRYPPPFCSIERYCLRRCAGWIACGQTTVETLRPRGYSSKPHRVMPLGVDVDRFCPDARAGQEVRRQLNWSRSGPPVIGFLGRFVPEKGVPHLMRVLERLPVRWRALFVGSGPLEGELREWSRAFDGRVRVITEVKHHEVPAYLNAMDVLCTPSQTTPTWREQLGRMIIEAFACGIPVIGSTSGEIPYVIRDAGVVVEENDILAWARELANLLESPSLRAHLGQRGFDRAQTTYAWPVLARRHLDFFEELLDAPRR